MKLVEFLIVCAAVAVILAAAFLIAKAIAESDLPFWMKFWLLRK